MEKVKLTMVLDGYSPTKGKIEDLSKGISLVSDAGEIAATWHYKGLIEHWKRKHDQAVYVPSLHREEPINQYRYGKRVLLAERTDLHLVLKAMHEGAVFYDPGIKLEKASTKHPVVKRRSQFRVMWRNLANLYESTNQALLKA
jgi:hypothetical protein